MKFIATLIVGAILLSPASAFAAEGDFCKLPIKVGSLAFIGDGTWGGMTARVVSSQLDYQGSCRYNVRVRPYNENPSYWTVKVKYVTVKKGNLYPIEYKK